MPKVFKKIWPGMHSPRRQAKYFMEEIIRGKTKKNWKTGSGWNIWLLVIAHCGRKKKSSECMRELEIMLMTRKVLSLRGPTRWLRSWHSLRCCWGGILTTISCGWETEAQRSQRHAPQQIVDSGQNQNSKPGRFLLAHSASTSRKVQHAVLGGGWETPTVNWKSALSRAPLCLTEERL